MLDNKGFQGRWSIPNYFSEQFSADPCYFVDILIGEHKSHRKLPRERIKEDKLILTSSLAGNGLGHAVHACTCMPGACHLSHPRSLLPEHSDQPTSKAEWGSVTMLPHLGSAIFRQEEQLHNHPYQPWKWGNQKNRWKKAKRTFYYSFICYFIHPQCYGLSIHTKTHVKIFHCKVLRGGTYGTFKRWLGHGLWMNRSIDGIMDYWVSGLSQVCFC